jgi:hypothetical protein
LLSTFVGRVDRATGDSFTFVDVQTKSGPAMPDRVVVEILAARPNDGERFQRFTSCDVVAAQPLVGGVYQVTVDPDVPSINSCVGTFSLVTAPPTSAPSVRQAVAAAVDAPAAAPATDDGYRPIVPIVLGGVLLAIGVGVALNRRRARPL